MPERSRLTRGLMASVAPPSVLPFSDLPNPRKAKALPRGHWGRAYAAMASVQKLNQTQEYPHQGTGLENAGKQPQTAQNRPEKKF
jgi:hypothetical protein